MFADISCTVRFRGGLSHEKKGNAMNIGEARRIFDNIDSQQYTDEQKGEAILRVLKMETHNSVTKESAFKVIRHMFELCYEVQR